jgi:aspartate/methionine/tyrosine aminotransferase
LAAGKIVKHDFQAQGCDITADEIFISDGSKCDCGNILDIFGHDNTIAVTDPVYPVYVDTNVMAGHTGPASDDGKYEGLVYLPISADNNFTAEIPTQKVDLIYLCFPNNPTGATATKAHLQDWVNYALKHGSLLLFDAAYEAYITDPEIPHSIYEIPGCAGLRDRVSLLLKKCGLYRYPLCLHRGAQDPEGQGLRRVRCGSASPVESPPSHQVQRGLLHRAAGG